MAADMRLPRYPRFLNQLYAVVFGFFWSPCPLCGTYFGGHEWPGTWYYTPTEGVAICWKHGGNFDHWVIPT